MALNGYTLGYNMKLNVDNYIATLTDNQKNNITEAIREEIFNQMGLAIVKHIQDWAVVTSVGTTTGVTVGAGTAPCSTTGSIA